MKCVIGFLFFSVCAVQTMLAIPVHRNGMVFYQSPDFYNAHRAFVMQYASQPVRAYRRTGQAAASGVTAFASGKKIATGTYLKQADEVDEEELKENESLDGAVQSVAEAYPAPESDEVDQGVDEEPTDVANQPAYDEPEKTPANDIPEESPVPEVQPPKFVPSNNKKTPIQRDEEDEDDEEEPVAPNRSTKQRGSQGGASYFPVTFGSTNGGAIAIANSYSTGKGGSASSRATAYGSPAKPKRRTSH